MRIDGGMVAFWTLGIIWGSNFIFMKWASVVMDPIQIVQARVLLGLLPVTLLAVARGDISARHARHAHHFIVMAMLAAVAYYYGFAKGTSLLASGVAGALSGAIPLFSFLAAMLLLPGERRSAATLACLLTGLVGVLVIADPFEAGATAASQWEGMLYMSLGSLSLGVSFVYAKRFVTPLNLPAPALTTYQLAIASVILWSFVAPPELQVIENNPKALWGLVMGLGVLGTGVAYVIYYAMLRRLGAVRAASVTYIPPVVALLVGGLLAGERITVQSLAGTSLILASVAVLSRISAKEGATSAGRAR